MGVSDRDVYLHTLPQFHCNGWGMLYAVTGMGGKHIILRKVDGAEILRRVERARRHADVRRAGRAQHGPRRGERRGTGPIPGRGPTRIVVAGAPPPTRTIERCETELGWEFIQIYGLTETSPLLTMNRTRAEFDDLSPADRAVDAQPRRRAGDRLRDGGRRRAARCSPAATWSWRATGSSPRRRPTAIVDGWFHTGDGGSIDEINYVTISDRKKDVIISGGENVSSIEVEDAIFQHPDVTEVAVIGIPDEKWGELVTALVVKSPGSDADRGRGHRLDAARSSPATSARSGSSSATSSPARPPASCRSSSCARPSGKATTARSTETRRPVCSKRSHGSFEADRTRGLGQSKATSRAWSTIALEVAGLARVLAVDHHRPRDADRAG